MNIALNNVSFINGYAIFDYTVNGVRHNHNELYVGDASTSRYITRVIMTHLRKQHYVKVA